MGAVGFALVRCAVTLWYLVWDVGAGLRPDAMLLRRQLAYAIPFYLSGLVELVQSNLHQYVVAYRFDAATFAIYSVGCLQIPLVELVFASMATVMMVRMGEALRDGRDGAAREIWHDTSRKLALLLFPLVGLLVVIARPLIVFLFTDTYAASAPIFMVWSLVLLWPALAVDGVLRVYAETRFLFALNAARLVITVALIGALIGSFGLIGAILSTLIAAVVSRAVGLGRIGMLMKIKAAELLPWRDLGTILGAASLAAASVVAADLALDLSPLPTLVVGGLLYGVVYLTAVWRLGALREDERSALTAQLARWGLVITSGAAVRSERTDSCVEPEK
jgi:O-antigen/teichoic acid export membrane protein